jgi:hypothetical protein
MSQKHLSLAAIGILCCASLAALPAIADAADYEGTTFSEVWDDIASDPYEVLPQYEVTLERMFDHVGWFPVNRILEASKRTLENSEDLYPIGVKLVHANGVCLAGTWNITEDNPYTGYFRPGSIGLIIVRASTLLSDTTRGSYRAFGVAGKIFPTTNPNHTDALRSANFFALDSAAGTLAESFLDVGLQNDLLSLMINKDFIKASPALAATFEAFIRAERALNPLQAAERQLYPVAELGETDLSAVNTPRWIQIAASPEIPRVDETDFRDELDIDNYPGGLQFDVFVSDTNTRLEEKEWTRIGHIDITDSVASEGCDTRLHFPHPKFR